MNRQNVPTPLLHKQNSWSPDIHREEAWMRKKESSSLRRTKTSVTDDELEELKGCIELGFGFDSSAAEVDPKLVDTLPALRLYHSVNRHYHRSLSRSSSAASFASSSLLEEIDGDGAGSIYDPGDDPATVKTRLRQWAQVVACSVLQNKTRRMVGWSKLRSNFTLSPD